MSKRFIDTHRGLIKVFGGDAAEFLQGIITNDIHKASYDAWIYSLFLTPQGKIIADLFIQKVKDGYILDCPNDKMETIIKRFSVYKLKSNVDFHLDVSKKILISDEEGFQDPRNKNLFSRSVVDNGSVENGFDQYHIIRMNLKIPDFHMDISQNDLFPHELGMNDLNAIDYKKGCYVGQEVTARVEYRGSVRKKLYVIKVANPKTGDEIITQSDGKEVGKILGFIGETALSIIKDCDLNELSCAGKDVKVIS